MLNAEMRLEQEEMGSKKREHGFVHSVTVRSAHLLAGARETMVTEQDTVPVLMELRFLGNLTGEPQRPSRRSVWVSAVPQAAG